jgi:hypothetical protein
MHRLLPFLENGELVVSASRAWSEDIHATAAPPVPGRHLTPSSTP